MWHSALNYTLNLSVKLVGLFIQIIVSIKVGSEERKIMDVQRK